MRYGLELSCLFAPYVTACGGFGPCRRTSTPSCRTWLSSSRRCCSSTARCPEEVAAEEAPAQALGAAGQRLAVRAGTRCAALSRRWPTRWGRRLQRRPALRCCDPQPARSLVWTVLMVPRAAGNSTVRGEAIACRGAMRGVLFGGQQCCRWLECLMRCRASCHRVTAAGVAAQMLTTSGVKSLFRRVCARETGPAGNGGRADGEAGGCGRRRPAAVHGQHRRAREPDAAQQPDATGAVATL